MVKSLDFISDKVGSHLRLLHKNVAPFDLSLNMINELALCVKSMIKARTALAGVAQWIERGLQIKGLLVQFPVRARAWVSGQFPSWGCVRGNRTLMLLSLSFSFPSPLSKNK